MDNLRHKEMLSQQAPSLAAFDNQVNGKLTQPRRYGDRYLGTITVKLPHLSVLKGIFWFQKSVCKVVLFWIQHNV